LICIFHLSSKDPYFVIVSKDHAQIVRNVGIDHFEPLLKSFLEDFVKNLYEKRSNLSSFVTPTLLQSIRAQMSNDGRTDIKVILLHFRWEPYQNSKDKFAVEAKILCASHLDESFLKRKKLILLLERGDPEFDNPSGLKISFLKEILIEPHP